MLHLGLTGGIGSGKSTVAALLAQHGAKLIDADAISRASTAVGGAAIDAIRKSFGGEALTPEGALNRDAMRALVFADASAKSRLEAIIHPLVGIEVARQTQEAENSGARCAVFDIPLLVESIHWRKRLHAVMVVDCREATQIQRVMARNSLTSAEIEKIIASQATRAQRLAAADVILFNDGITLSQLASEIGQIAVQFGL